MHADPDALRTLGRDILAAAGATPASAHTVADHLVGANLAGHDSHGVIRIPEYLRDIRRGVLNPAAVPQAKNIRDGVHTIDGDWGFGQVAGRLAVDVGVTAAGAHGLAAVAVTRCHHLGRMGEYSERASAAGCASLLTAGGHPPIAVPFLGRDRFLGANPFAAGFPTTSDPFVMDFATTSVAVGKVMVAQARGEQLAEPVIVDAQGRASRDPADFANGGALTPFGGHKGFALAMFSELLCRALVGGTDPGQCMGGAFGEQTALFLMMSADLFQDATTARRAAGAVAAAARAVPPAPGARAVLVPGDPERGNRQARRAGVPLEEATVAAVLAAAAEVGVPADRSLIAATDRERA